MTWDSTDGTWVAQLLQAHGIRTDRRRIEKVRARLFPSTSRTPPMLNMSETSTTPDGSGERLGYPWLLLDESEDNTGPEDTLSMWWAVYSGSSRQYQGPLSDVGCASDPGGGCQGRALSPEGDVIF